MSKLLNNLNLIVKKATELYGVQPEISRLQNYIDDLKIKHQEVIDGEQEARKRHHASFNAKEKYPELFID
jgi:hypothetical protein